MSAIRHGDRVTVPPGRPGGVVGGARWTAEGEARSVTVYAAFEWGEEGRRWETGPASPVGLRLSFGGPSAPLALEEPVPAVGLAVHVVAAHLELQVVRLVPTALPYRLRVAIAPGQPVRVPRTLVRGPSPSDLPAFTVSMHGADVIMLDPGGDPLPTSADVWPGAFAVAPGAPLAVRCEVVR